jgi:hypothetical protein
MREAGVLEREESPHDNLWREIIERQANQMRDRKIAMEQLHAHGPKAFLRRFKMSRPLFNDLVQQIRPMVEADTVGKEHAR